MHYHRSLLITGGAGFIGSHVVRLLANKYPQYHIVCLDKLTYAGNLKTLEDVASLPNYTFVEADICDYERMRTLITEHAIDGIIHLAAESHVDRSISDPFTFARTNSFHVRKRTSPVSALPCGSSWSITYSRTLTAHRLIAPTKKNIAPQSIEIADPAIAPKNVFFSSEIAL